MWGGKKVDMNEIRASKRILELWNKKENGGREEGKKREKEK